METKKLQEILKEQEIRTEIVASNYKVEDKEMKAIVETVMSGDTKEIERVGLSEAGRGIIKPLAEEVGKLAEASVYILGEKLRDAEEIGKVGIPEMTGVVINLIKMQQLLTGGVTDSVGVMSVNISKRIIEGRELYD